MWFQLYVLTINYFVFCRSFFAAKHYLKERYFLNLRNPELEILSPDKREKRAKIIVAIGNALITIINCLFFFYFSGEGYLGNYEKRMVSTLFRNVLNGYYIYDTVNVLKRYNGSLMDKFYLFHHAVTISCLPYNLENYHIVTVIFYAEISNLPLYCYKYKLMDFKIQRGNKKSTQLKSSIEKILTLKKVEFVVYGIFRVFFIGHIMLRIFIENKYIPMPFYPMIIIYFCGVYYTQKLWRTMDRII